MRDVFKLFSFFVKQIVEAGGEAIFVQTDVTQAKEVQTLVDRTLEQYGRLDAAFNNAGSGKDVRLIDLTEDEWEQEIAINLKSVWLCLKYQIPAMLKPGKGAIVNMASQGAILGVPNYTAYAAAKEGAAALTRAAAAEYAAEGIRINAISPGAVETELWANAPAGMLEQVAAGIPMQRVGSPRILQKRLFGFAPMRLDLLQDKTLPLMADTQPRTKLTKAMLKNKRRQFLLIGSSAIASTFLSNKIATAQSLNHPIMNSTTDRDAIINAVNQIAIMADLRNWEACRDAFSDRVATDYTSLTGGEPTTVNAEDLVNGWETFFSQTFKVTQHLIGSHVVTITGDTATCLSNFQAHHVYLDITKGTWTLGGVYKHGLIQTPQGWKVNRTKMTWTWESGNRP